MSKKPPIGLMPKYLWKESRFNDVRKAIARYFRAGRVIPIEWIEEYNEFLKERRS